MAIQLKRNDTKDTISYTMTYADGTPVNLTGATVRFVMGKGKTLITSDTAIIVSATAGKVEYTLKENDTLLAGNYNAEFEVTFSTGKVKTFPNDGYISIKIQPNVDGEQSTYIEDQIAYRVSDIQILKNSIQAQLDQFAAGATNAETSQARVEADGTTNTTLKARLDKKEAKFASDIQTLSSSVAQNAKSLGYSIESEPRITPEVDDSGRLQRLINKLTSGGVITFEAKKTYSILTTLTSLDNISFVGYGSILQGNGTKILVNTGNNNYLEGIEFNNCTIAINGQGKNNVSVYRCRFIDIKNVGVYYYGCKESFVMNSYFYDIKKDSINVDNDSSDIEISHNIFDNPSLYGGYGTEQTTAHVNCLNGHRIDVSYNVVKNNGGQGIIFSYNSSSQKGTTNSKAIGNYCEGNGQEGITSFGGTGKYAKDNIISNNICKNNRFHQIEVWLSQNVSVVGNIVEEDTNTGNMGAITIYGTDNAVVDANEVLKAKSNGIAILFGTKHSSIKNNLIKNTNLRNSSNAQDGNGIVLDPNGGVKPSFVDIKNNTIISENVALTTASKAGVYSTYTDNQNNDINYNRAVGYQQQEHTFALQTCYNRGSAVPTVGTWFLRDKYYYVVPTANGYEGLMCTTEGTQGTLSGVTGSATISTPTLTVNDSSNLEVGQYILIAGVTGKKRIIAKSGTIITLNSNVDATVTGAAISYSNAVFKGFGLIQA
jgi:hypothetical protein